MALINFFSEDTKFVLKNKRVIRKWLFDVSEKEGFFIDNINIIFVSDDYLHKLNVEYLKHDTLTDIITFHYNSPEENILSDLYISIDRVKENAVNLKNKQLDELHRVIVHGLLHLLGYMDKTDDEKALMRSKEDNYLSLLPL